MRIFTKLKSKTPTKLYLNFTNIAFILWQIGKEIQQVKRDEESRSKMPMIVMKETEKKLRLLFCIPLRTNMTWDLIQGIRFSYALCMFGCRVVANL